MRATTARLAPVDEANLVLDHEGQVNVFLVAGVLDPGGFLSPDGQPDLASLRAAVRVRIDALPSLRQVPVSLGRRHRWQERVPDLERHVRLVETVEGLAGLERACGRLMTVPLPLDRPPWELLIVPVGDGAVGFVLRIHHAIADGMAAVAIVHELFAHTAPTVASGGTSASQPADTELSTVVPRRRYGHPRHRVRKLLFGLRRVLTTLTATGVGPTVLLGDRSASRGVAFVDTDLRALTAHARTLGVTVNDCLLAAAAAGYVALFSASNEPIPLSVPVSVPVALRRRGRSGNQVGVMLVRLPVRVSDPEERLTRIATQTRAGKERAREQGTLELMRGPRGARLMDRIARRQRFVAGFVTNVPGPTTAMTLAGAPVAAIWPVAVVAANVRLGVAAASYDSRLWCSVHFDEASVPGAVFARAMSREFARMTR